MALHSLRETLKYATAAEPAALEQTGVLRAFSGAASTPAVYADYLVQQWHLHRAMEPTLQGLLGAGWAAARFVKTVWLDQDLAAVHCAAEVRDVAWDRPRSATQALA